MKGTGFSQVHIWILSPLWYQTPLSRFLLSQHREQIQSCAD